MRARLEATRGLVEADVSIAADSEYLEVDATGVADGLFVGAAVALVIARDGAVRNMNVGRGNIYVSEEILLHEVMETLGVSGREAQVLVQIESDDLGKIERFLAMQTYQLFVHSDRGAAGRQAEAQRWVPTDGVGDDSGGFAAEFLLAGF